MEKERLQKVIANFGYCSRRHAEKLIIAKRVKVNDVIISELGIKISVNDVIKIDGKVINNVNKKIYILFNKPKNILTTTKDPKNRETVMDFLTNIKERIYPVGRLDYDTTGLLLFTNDGDFANLIMHPKYEINKKYLAVIDGDLKVEEIKKLENGVKLHDGFITSKSLVTSKRYVLNTNKSYVEIIIHEGKNHQVKNMFEAVNHKVIKLTRIEIENLKIDNLRPGQYRFLTNKEVDYFFKKFS